MIDLQIWIFLAAACFLGEMLTTTFFLMWFGVGASVSAVLNYLGFDPLTQSSFLLCLSVGDTARDQPGRRGALADRTCGRIKLS